MSMGVFVSFTRSDLDLSFDDLRLCLLEGLEVNSRLFYLLFLFLEFT